MGKIKGESKIYSLNSDLGCDPIQSGSCVLAFGRVLLLQCSDGYVALEIY